jgi:hypothetical protein
MTLPQRRLDYRQQSVDVWSYGDFCAIDLIARNIVNQAGNLPARSGADT